MKEVYYLIGVDFSVEPIYVVHYVQPYDMAKIDINQDYWNKMKQNINYYL